MNDDEILEDYPDLEREDLKACLLFASRFMQMRGVHTLAS